MTIDILIKGNAKRKEKLFADYNPLTGEGAPLERKKFFVSGLNLPVQYCPLEFFEEDLIKDIHKSKSIQEYFNKKKIDAELLLEALSFISNEFFKLRCKHDFLFWAYSCVKIKNKKGGKMIPFKPTQEQLIIFHAFEKDRLAGKPLRFILVKPRQFGGSTFIQIYMAWIQLFWKESWYSTIIAQTLGTSRKIKAMYSKFIADYPVQLLGFDTGKAKFSPYEGSANDFYITVTHKKEEKKPRDIAISIGTYEKPDNLRGGDSAMVHYSEVAYWNETIGKKPSDVIKSISGGILEEPFTMEVLESSPNGTGNYFYEEYILAKQGLSTRKAIFIAWWETSLYTKPLTPKEEEELVNWLIDNRDKDEAPAGYRDSGKYYWHLWNLGATLQGIAWYRKRRLGMHDHSEMASEFPSDDIEAFAHSGRPAFDLAVVAEIKAEAVKFNNKVQIGEIEGKSVKGVASLQNIKFKSHQNGNLKIWWMPDKTEKIRHRYLTVVDVGGRSLKSDFSDILVIDREPLIYHGRPKIVAEWHGHISHDLLAWKACQIASYYDTAMLAIEINTYEKGKYSEEIDPDFGEYVLSIIGKEYPNMYYRQGKVDDIKEKAPTKQGWITDRWTKPRIIAGMMTMVSNKGWVETEPEACDEMSYYEIKKDGSYGNIAGKDKHDDRVMVRAIAFEIASKDMPQPQYIEANTNKTVRQTINESFI